MRIKTIDSELREGPILSPTNMIMFYAAALRCGKWLGLMTLALWIAVPASGEEAPNGPGTAQLVGTVQDGRGRWNPFHASNDMVREGDGTFSAGVNLSCSGGRNGDGIYAMRFVTDNDLAEVFKRGVTAGTLVSGPEAAFAGNIIFRVSTNGPHVVRFDPRGGTYAISPPVEEIDRIGSMQINGFVHDAEGSVECFDGRRTRPAEKWDEWVPAHELRRNGDGSWSATLRLSAKGGHEKNGVYQCLLSANHNADHGYGAILGRPGRLAGGNGYESRSGRTGETAIIFRVPRDDTYTLTVWPDDYRFEISPPVTFFQTEEYQVDGDVVPDPWNPASPDHDMEKGADGRWRKALQLTKDGGSQGLYTMNFSIDGNWALDSIGTGGIWGKTWHSAPQESNIHFRVPADGTYTVTLDPAAGTFSFDPPVEPVTEIASVEISGDFEEFAGDGAAGWNPLDPMHTMKPQGNGTFTKDLRLSGGRTYTYKYTANRAGWAWPLVDYPYDGVRKLAPHGSPPPMSFECPRPGIYRFSADVNSGEYSVVMLKHL